MNKLEDIIKEHKNGVTINLFITPGSKKNIFPAGLNEWRKCVEMNVCSSTQDNKANMEVLKTIAGFFEKPVKDVFVVSGERNREKTVLVKDASVSDIVNRLQESLNEL